MPHNNLACPQQEYILVQSDDLFVQIFSIRTTILVRLFTRSVDLKARHKYTMASQFGTTVGGWFSATFDNRRWNLTVNGHHSDLSTLVPGRLRRVRHHRLNGQ